MKKGFSVSEKETASNETQYYISQPIKIALTLLFESQDCRETTKSVFEHLPFLSFA